MKYLVTGGVGFIGTAVCLQLLNAGHDVVAWDNLDPYYDTSLKRTNLGKLRGLACSADFSFQECDVIDAATGSALNDIDHVIHLAGQPGVRSSWRAGFDSHLRNNVLATQRILEAGVAVGFQGSIAIASSSSVYGERSADVPFREQDPVRPFSPYGASKLAVESLCNVYSDNFGLKVIPLRYFTVYGPGQRPDMAFNRFIRAGLGGETLTIYGTGEQRREFTFVEDIAEATIKVSQVPDLASGSILNLGGGSSVSVNECLATIELLLGKTLEIEHLAAQSGDVSATRANIDRASALLGWLPTTPLESGLKRQVDSLVSARPS